MTITIKRPDRQPLTAEQLNSLRRQPDDSPLARAKRVVYIAGLPAATVPFLEDLYQQIATLEKRLGILEASAREGRPIVPAGTEVRA